MKQERQTTKEETAGKGRRALLAGNAVGVGLLFAGFLLLRKEIRQRVEIEEELRRHHDRLEEVVRQRTLQLERAKIDAETAANAKTEFLANMSHEMRTPLTGVMGVIDVLLLDELPREHRRYLEMARTSAQALNSLIMDLLDFSRFAGEGASLALEPFDLRRCIRSVTDIFALEADKKGLKCNVEISDDVPERVVGNEARLRQVLVNLVGNAVKFTERGAVDISVMLAGEHVRPEGIMLLLFSVRDTGIGIPSEDLKHIFEKFSQLDTSPTKRFGGTGLGLAFSAQIIAYLGGKLWVDSRAGEGSTFSFTIPLIPRDHAVKKRANEPKPGQPRWRCIWNRYSIQCQSSRWKTIR